MLASGRARGSGARPFRRLGVRRIDRVRLLVLAGSAAEDLRDHAEVAVRGEVREVDAVVLAAQEHFVPAAGSSEIVPS